MKINVPKSTRLVAVSKLQPPEKIRALYDEGQRIFAENYVQEALTKIETLKDLSEIQWHFIGSLQKNKVKMVIGNFELIHSVDSFGLAEVISKIAGQRNVTQRILMQVNLSGEESKGGFDPLEVAEALPNIAALPNTLLTGFMTMPPLFDDAEKSRPFFKELCQLKEKYKKTYPSLTELSMGTSHDYSVAVEEGATLIRIGTLLFGERPKKQ
jgi:pyridoxal phosphate enzyme (YggS family)